MTNWEIHGLQFTNCSCAYGCPCQFNALPTHGYCRAVIFVQVDKGHFGDARLDGLNMALAIAWPGAVHQGHGIMQPAIDERGSKAQRAALLDIMTGKEADPMKTIFSIYTAMSDTILEPIYTKVSIDLDVTKREAKCEAKGIATGRGEPIRNATTDEESRATIVLPNGIEFDRAEVGRGWSESFGGAAMVLADSHAHWNEMHLNQHGRIR
ncbi:MAG: DUF1326 domain-containing protein [Cucumibacter sp.]